MLTRFRGINALAKFFVILGVIILVLAVSLSVFTLGYWLITLILANFFAYTLPFTFNYAFGGWLIALVIYTFLLPSAIKFKLD